MLKKVEWRKVRSCKGGQTVVVAVEERVYAGSEGVGEQASRGVVAIISAHEVLRRNCETVPALQRLCAIRRVRRVKNVLTF